LAQRREEPGGAQRGEPPHGTQRDVHRMAAVVERASAMGHAGPRPSWLPPGALAAPAPAAEGERGLARILLHLDWADIIENKHTCQVTRVSPPSLTAPGPSCASSCARRVTGSQRSHPCDGSRPR
jgi:hypothetical protein